MAEARDLVRDYAEAGFTKIHLDASMACADDGELTEEAIAARAAELCAVAEQHAGGTKPLYVIGTEVPRPGGETEALNSFAVTRPEAPLRTYELHRQAFDRLGLAGALDRVIGIVVQPGVDFGNTHVFAFDKAKAGALSAADRAIPGAVFEAHSTDYQSQAALRDLVASHFAILKVGPELTSAFREAVVAMAMIETRLPFTVKSGILDCVIDDLKAKPGHWRGYVGGWPAPGYRPSLRAQRPHPLLLASSPRSRPPCKLLYRNIDAATDETSLISQFAPHSRKLCGGASPLAPDHPVARRGRRRQILLRLLINSAKAVPSHSINAGLIERCRRIDAMQREAAQSASRFRPAR